MTTFEDYIRQAWEIHAEHPKRVTQRIRLGSSLVKSPEELMQLAQLLTHVYGEHLARWEQGIEVLRELKKHFYYVAGSEVSKTITRGIASLRVASGDERGLEVFSISDRIRIFTIAASALNVTANKEAQRLYRLALDLYEKNPLPATDPANRSLAGTGNNLALALEKQKDLDEGDRAFLLLAGEMSLKHWGFVGSWLEVQRAEYRLCKICLTLKQDEKALRHAENCVAMVNANPTAPELEKFFAFEALALATKSAGRITEFTKARTEAGRHYNQLSDQEKAACGHDWKKAV